MNPVGLESRVRYRIEKDSLVCLEDDDYYIGWEISFYENDIILYNGNDEYMITGTIGKFNVRSMSDDMLNNLEHQFTELLNYHIRDYTIEEFVTVFNYMIESVEELTKIIKSYKIKGMPGNIKRSL